jgi:hypothetical protein
MALNTTKERGVVADPATGRRYKLTERYYGSRYDTVVTAAGAITASTQKKFFNTMTDKDKTDANFPAARRLLSAGEEMTLEQIGIYIPQCIGNTLVSVTDMKRGSENFYIDFKIDRDTVAEGPAITFAPGYGLAGNSTENASGNVTIGVPSSAAVRKLAETQPLDDESDIECVGTWFDHVWDATNMPTLITKVWHRLHAIGLIVKPATRKGK